MPTVEANGITLYYEVKGSGTPLLLINGWGGNLDSWSTEMIDMLAEHHKVIMMDNRGTGRSSKPDEPYTIDMMAADAAGLVDALEVGPVHVMGFSMGGIITQAFGLNYPEKTLSLILCSTQPGGLHRISSDPEVQMELALIANPLPEMTERDRTVRLLYLLYSDDYVEKNLEALIRNETYADNPTPDYALMRQSGAMAGFDSFDRLSEMVFPVLVMVGLDDKMIPPENSEILAERIPQAEIIRLPGCGHGFLKQKTGEAVAHILGFLGRVDG